MGQRLVRGHHTPAYSLLSPALGALLGVRVAGALAAVAAAGLFALIAERWWGAAAGRFAAVWFAIGVLAQLVSGRLTFLLGAAFGLAALLALQRARPLLACALAVLTSVASPVAGLFLALAAIAYGLATARRAPSGPQATAHTEPSAVPAAARREAAPRPRAEAARREASARGAAAALALPALAPAAILAILFPEGGTEPFVASAFWPALVAIGLVAVALPACERTLRVAAALYGLTCIAAFAVATPLGGNVTRLGALAAGPVLGGALLAARSRGCAGKGLRGALEGRALLAVLALPLAYWQLYPAVRDVVRASGDPSTGAAYYAPLLRFLEGRPGAFRVEIPFTANHWEAAHVAPRVPLARGWERQLDRRYGALFYDGTLTARRTGPGSTSTRWRTSPCPTLPWTTPRVTKRGSSPTARPTCARSGAARTGGSMRSGARRPSSAASPVDRACARRLHAQGRPPRHRARSRPSHALVVGHERARLRRARPSRLDAPARAAPWRRSRAGPARRLRLPSLSQASPADRTSAARDEPRHLDAVTLGHGSRLGRAGGPPAASSAAARTKRFIGSPGA